MKYRVNNIVYAAGPDLLGTIRMCITMTDPVDPELLAAALKKATPRFPYFAVRLVKRAAECSDPDRLIEEYILKPNPLPFVVSPGGRAVVLGSPESNWHLNAFAYDGNRLYIDSSHFITDGNGIFPFIRTILFYYLSALHTEAGLDPVQFGLADAPAPDTDDGATADDYPYPEEPLPGEPTVIATRPAEIFKLPDQPQGYPDNQATTQPKQTVQPQHPWVSFVFRIRQSELMSYVSGVDGSPASFVASLMFKAIAQLHPDNRLPVVCGMQHQFRHALGRPDSHMCHVNIVPMTYPASLAGKDIEMLNTIGRGMLILRADGASDIVTINRHIQNDRLIRSLTLPEKQAHMRRELLAGIGENTFEVSYTGRVDWGGLERYIVDAVPFLDMTLSGGISVEIFSVGDIFSVNIMQRSTDPKYAERFAELLEASGIEFAALAPEPFELPGFELCS